MIGKSFLFDDRQKIEKFVFGVNKASHFLLNVKVIVCRSKYCGKWQTKINENRSLVLLQGFLNNVWKMVEMIQKIYKIFDTLVILINPAM